MAEEESLRRDFHFLLGREDVSAVMLFGSRAIGEETPRSDTDICVVAPGCRNRVGLLKEIHERVDVYGKKYDVKIFEDLPLYLKIGVIEKGKVIEAKDVYALYEYFYTFRKLWGDQARRQRLAKEEIARMLSGRGTTR
jgi:predicted nucleotidyltransferase